MILTSGLHCLDKETGYFLKSESNIEIGEHTKRSDKNNENVKDFSYRKRFDKLGLTTFFVNGPGDLGSIPGRVSQRL